MLGPRTQLDDVVPSRGEHPERTRDNRWIYLHMIEEHARHDGHADLIRERIDGVIGDSPPCALLQPGECWAVSFGI
jgi:hypothetical protein